MSHREVGGTTHELLSVREVNGAPRVDCPHRGEDVLFSECQACEHGTVVRLKGSRLPYVVCPSEGPARAGLTVWPRDTVSTIMTKVVPVRPSLSIEKLVRLFLDEGVGAAPVVDETGAAVGMVTKADLVSDDAGWTKLRDGVLSSWPEGSERDADVLSEDDLFLHELLRARTVGDVMARPLVWVRPDLTISAAAEVMGMSGRHHLPVLGEGDRPVGMLGADELARWVGAQR